MKGTPVTTDKNAHGHVIPRLDGHKARCGGPWLGCAQCLAEARANGIALPPTAPAPPTRFASSAAPAPPAFKTSPPPDADLEIENMAMLIRMLVRAVRRYDPGASIAKVSLDYLKDRDLLGSPLRNDPGTT